MSYLKKLELDKINREKYESETEVLKKAIFDINSYYVIHDGEFLIQLVKFLKTWENKKV